MSDISVLTHEYRTTSEFLRKLNDAVVILKRAYYNLPGKESMKDEHLVESQQILRTILTYILDILKPEEKPVARFLDEHLIPRSFVEHIYEKNKGKIEYYIADLQEARQHLIQGLSYVTERDLALLDQIADAVDVETSRIFRKLWRK